jgi:hypothetical protein
MLALTCVERGQDSLGDRDVHREQREQRHDKASGRWNGSFIIFWCRMRSRLPSGLLSPWKGAVDGYAMQWVERRVVSSLKVIPKHASPFGGHSMCGNEAVGR